MQSKFRYQIYVLDPVNPLFPHVDDRDVYPVNEAEFIIEETRKEEKVYFIKKIKNKLRIDGLDFNHYYSQLNFCYKYYVKIYKWCSADWTHVYDCYFNQNNITYDLDQCVAEIDLQDTSIYNCFDDRRSEEANIIPPAATIIKYPPSPVDNFRAAELLFAVSTVLTAVNCEGKWDAVSDFFGWYIDPVFGTNLGPTSQALTNYVNATPGYMIYIGSKADAIDPNATNPTTILNMSFDDVEKLMSEVFNVYWFIDVAGYVRFEHFSYFSTSVNYDTTIASNVKMNEYNRKFEFDNTELPKSETFKFNEANDPIFVGQPIYYSEECGTNGKDEDRGFTKVSTDIGFLLNNTALDPKGFVLYDVYTVGPAFIVYDGGTGYNDRLGYTKLLPDLHKHKRPFKTGIMNGVTTNFLSPVYNKIQNNVLCQMCCIDGFQKYDSLVRTELGEGEIQSAEINYTKEVIKFKLKHDNIL